MLKMLEILEDKGLHISIEFLMNLGSCTDENDIVQ